MIWSLQVLRFIAAMMVVYLHCVLVAGNVTGGVGFIPIEISIIGTSGVDIFFVLSGVVIAKTAARFTPSEFLWRRFRRIMPIYLVCSLPFLPKALIHGSGWREWLATFLLWPATDVMTLPALNVGWTLAFEMVFYLSAALVLLNRRWLYVLLGFYVIASQLRGFGPVFQFLGNPLIVEFLLGVAIAHAPMKRIGLLGFPVAFMALFCAGWFHLISEGGITDYLSGRDSTIRVLVLGLPAAFIVYATMQITAGKSVWTYLGDASYALYLVHPAATALLAGTPTFVPFRQPDTIIVIGVLSSLVLAWRVHELVEGPILSAFPKTLPTMKWLLRSA